MERYDPQTIEAKWQRVWEDERAFHDAEPRPRRGGGRAPLVPAGDAPVPVGVAPHGARPQLHDGRRPDAPAPAERLARAAPDGLRLVRPACRECCDPRRRASAQEHRALHRPHARADEAAGLGDRLGPRGLSAPARVLPLDAVAVPEVLRARPRVPEGGAGQLVPERPDGRRERVRHRRPLRALRSARWRRGTSSSGSSRSPTTPTSCSSTTCRRAGSGRSGRRRSSATGSAARRARRSSSASTSWARTCPSSRRGRTRCSARRSSCWRRSIRSSSASAATRCRRTRSRPPPGAARSGPPRR